MRFETLQLNTTDLCAPSFPQLLNRGTSIAYSGYLKGELTVTLQMMLERLQRMWPRGSNTYHVAQSFICLLFIYQSQVSLVVITSDFQ